ncbi:MAG: PIG-L family deacetylase [Candidatus Dormibacteria bacterium]
MPTVPLTLMTVHAHPDQEATSTGGALRKYAGESIRTVLVTCTDGELGDRPGGVKPSQPGHDEQSVKGTGRREPAISCGALRSWTAEALGYHDSGMAEWDHVGAVGTFANSGLDEEIGRLADLIERYELQVLASYAEDGRYEPPDHIRTHQVALGAFMSSSIPRKLYYTVFAKCLVRRIPPQMKEAGTDPWEVGDIDLDPHNPPFGVADELVTTQLDVSAEVPAKLGAGRAYSSQMDNRLFASFPGEVATLLLGPEFYIRAIDRTNAPLPETDLFAGLR